MSLLLSERKLVSKILNNRISELNKYIYNSRKTLATANAYRTEQMTKNTETHISKMEYEIEKIENIIEKLDK